MRVIELRSVGTVLESRRDHFGIPVGSFGDSVGLSERDSPRWATHYTPFLSVWYGSLQNVATVYGTVRSASWTEIHPPENTLEIQHAYRPFGLSCAELLLQTSSDRSKHIIRKLLIS